MRAIVFLFNLRELNFEQTNTKHITNIWSLISNGIHYYYLSWKYILLERIILRVEINLNVV